MWFFTKKYRSGLWRKHNGKSVGLLFSLFFAMRVKKYYDKEGKRMMPKRQLKHWNLMDRFLFAEAADDPEFMEMLPAILFTNEIHLQYPPQTEKETRSFVFQKQMRMDV